VEPIVPGLSRAKDGINWSWKSGDSSGSPLMVPEAMLLLEKTVPAMYRGWR
jgi:hypothetical protein